MLNVCASVKVGDMRVWKETANSDRWINKIGWGEENGLRERKLKVRMRVWKEEGQGRTYHGISKTKRDITYIATQNKGGERKFLC